MDMDKAVDVVQSDDHIGEQCALRCGVRNLLCGAGCAVASVVQTFRCQM